MVEHIINSEEKRDFLFLNPQSQDLLFRQEKGSALRLFFIDYSNIEGENRFRVNVEQKGEDCRTEIYVLSFLRGRYRQHFTSRIVHAVGNGYSRQIIRYVLTDEAKGDFAGDVVLSPNAQHIDAQQSNRNLLLSNTATIRTRPCLEIYADDVKASHGSSTGQLDESALFYMQQRGLSFSEARDMLVLSFMSECIEPIADVAQREDLMHTLYSILQNA